MRKTLRRSCNACAKSKLRCDLLTPQCSRCRKTSRACIYANEPLSSPLAEDINEGPARILDDSRAVAIRSSAKSNTSIYDPGVQSFDPFKSYPQTRLPETQVERLIQHFLSKIAFQYYPLDKNATTNPFVVSWFPLALADPALFHVSLQTASLDMELREQKGFTNSDILMADSVSLVRLKVEDPVLAIQDETMDSVVTLAAIELGKGNAAVTKLHIDGLVSMVRMRGGIQQVKSVSPLTARMVSWVTMIALLSPQFATQDDDGRGDGIAPISQWIEITNDYDWTGSSPLGTFGLSSTIANIVRRLRVLFHDPERSGLSTTDFHDLVCFALHRLLEPAVQAETSTASPPSTSESVRHALALYLLIIHGPTYFSHAQLQYFLTMQLKQHLETDLNWTIRANISLAIWLVSVGLVASHDTPDHQEFIAQACRWILPLGVYGWEDVSFHLREVLWLEDQSAEHLFQRAWDGVWSAAST